MHFFFFSTGNMMSLLVFLSRYLRHLSWSVYLAALAVSDTGFLICLSFSWSDNIGLDIYHRHGWCQFLVYMTYVCCFLSVWYIVCFTAERYIVVKCPLQRPRICTIKRAKLIVISFAILAMAMYSFATWTTVLRPMYGRKNFCMPKMEHIKLLTILSYGDTAVTLIIPTVAIVLLNTCIIYTVTRCHKQALPTAIDKQQHTRPLVTLSISSASAVSQRTLSARHQTTLMHMTRMLVIVSTTFVLLNLPSHSIRIYTFFMTLYNPSYQASHVLVSCQKLFQYFYYLNFSINFVLYSVCGSQFRNAMRSMIEHHLGCCSGIRYGGAETDNPDGTVGTSIRMSRRAPAGQKV